MPSLYQEGSAAGQDSGFEPATEAEGHSQTRLEKAVVSSTLGAIATTEEVVYDPCADPNAGVPIVRASVDNMGTE